MRTSFSTTDDSDGVLVLDTSGQAGLSIVRSLGRRGVPVTAGSPYRWSLCRVARSGEGAYPYPDPDQSADRFIVALLEHLREVDYDAVVPVRDNTSALLARHKPEMEETGTTVAIEGGETFERTYD